MDSRCQDFLQLVNCGCHRPSRLSMLENEQRTMIFYESPHRLAKSLGQLAEVFGADRAASVSRELSKLHEENVRGSLGELIAYFSDRPVKGEIVVVVSGCEKP